MSQTPFEQAGALRIGTVDFVSPDEIKAMLDIEAPESVAMNTGGPRPFPRVNGYLLMPVDDGYLVGQVEWLTVERSAFPKRRGMQDFGLIDLPFPLRRLSMNPIGTLRADASAHGSFRFKRGSDALPSIGTQLLLPTKDQLRCIVESGERQRVSIGTSVLAGDARVSVDPNRLFGRHLAVLGNTGSGKSCSVAGLIRWCLDAAEEAKGSTPNARFIILDPNGEYAKAFHDEGSGRARIYQVAPTENANASALQIPLWFWNSSEWVAFTQASAKTQRPTLIHALRLARDGANGDVRDPGHETRRFLRNIVSATRAQISHGTHLSGFPKAKGFIEMLECWLKSFPSTASITDVAQRQSILDLSAYIEALCAPRRRQYADCNIPLPEVEEMVRLASNAHSLFGGTNRDTVPVDADAPLPFSIEAFTRNVEAAAEVLNVSEFVETLLIRVRSMLSDTRMLSILDDVASTSLDRWLNDYIGANQAENGPITIVDLSMVPTDVVHVITSVIARVVFEAMQRYVKIHKQALPTVLVMEEAHTFIRRYREDVENPDAASVCCQVFERIAREGRKFGLGLVLSSQRPSELSATVLSQCNTFLLHRISNDRDQDLVRRLVPDNLKGLLRELPSLPPQSAILLGWASELPVLVRMRNLPKNQQPRSEDPDYWGVWTGAGEDRLPIERAVDWAEIARDWQGSGLDSNPSAEESPPPDWLDSNPSAEESPPPDWLDSNPGAEESPPPDADEDDANVEPPF